MNPALAFASTTPVGTSVSCRNAGWLPTVLDALDQDGFCVVRDVYAPGFVAETRARLIDVQARVIADIGRDRLDAAGELGVVRSMFSYDPWFFRVIEAQPMLDVIDATISPTAVLHIQNGLVLPPVDAADRPEGEIFQLRFHRDFPRCLNGYLASINFMVAIDEFRADNGATLVAPGSHQLPDDRLPDPAVLGPRAIPAVCPAGGMIVFDSTLWHAAGENRSDRDRVSINHIFTRSYFKQQLDYPRLLGEELIVSQSERVQTMMGWAVRVPTSLDEYYAPRERRLYRSGQG